MITSLEVENLAVIESAVAQFGPALNVTTGETGAGKSVLMGALKAALGARVAADAVREGAKEARICAAFTVSGAPLDAVNRILENAGLPLCEDGELLVRRTISAAGGGKIRVNDAPSTVATLRQIGGAIADIHGPTDNQTLLKAQTQLALLDSFGAVDLAGYSRTWRELSDLRKELDALNASLNTANSAFEKEKLEYIVSELTEADITEADGEELLERHAAAAHAAQIVDAANAVREALDTSGVVSAISALTEMARYHPPAKEWLERAEALSVEMDDIASEVDSSVSRIDADPESLAGLDARVSLVQRLKRKYAIADAAQFPEFLEEQKAKLDAIDGAAGRIRSLEEEISAKAKELAAVAKSVTASRTAAAKKLAQAVTRELRDLGFREAYFDVAVAAKEPASDGADEIDFLFAPNPGEGVSKLAQIASSGETARVMLAVKTVLADADRTPILVFDEIDANIGGETGRAVGEKLAKIARRHQVLAITHLPQSAVFASTHLLVEKTVSGGRTRSTVRELEGEERIGEIVRMLGGNAANPAPGILSHARDLVETSRSS